MKMPVLTLPGVGFLIFTDALIFDNHAIETGIYGSLCKESSWEKFSMTFHVSSSIPVSILPFLPHQEQSTAHIRTPKKNIWNWPSMVSRCSINESCCHTASYRIIWSIDTKLFIYPTNIYWAHTKGQDSKWSLSGPIVLCDSTLSSYWPSYSSEKPMISPSLQISSLSPMIAGCRGHS